MHNQRPSIDPAPGSTSNPLSRLAATVDRETVIAWGEIDASAGVEALRGRTADLLPDSDSENSKGRLKASGNELLRLLRAKSRAEHDRLLSLSEHVTLDRGQVLSESGAPILDVYFPEGCVGSLVKELSDGRQIEVGTAGLEGMVGLPVFLGAETSPVKCVVQIGGTARRMKASSLEEIAVPGGALHDILQRYAQYLFDQAAQSIACNWLHGINERCARWLLMTHDRVHGDVLALTHEYLAAMLGTRRAGVSEAAEALQTAGLIHYRRGKITIVDRAGLERASCECYQTDRLDYERLLAHRD